PDAVATELAAFLEAPSEPLALALRQVHGSSIGRHERDLIRPARADVLAEAGDLLRELGYVDP
ncbi:MAG: hypothetical protein M3304_07260, partial [Actinomycetota bacterium]|nr:hypothetical protein [Actinomycetota bacterium]